MHCSSSCCLEACGVRPQSEHCSNCCLEACRVRSQCEHCSSCCFETCSVRPQHEHCSSFCLDACSIRFALSKAGAECSLHTHVFMRHSKSCDLFDLAKVYKHCICSVRHNDAMQMLSMSHMHSTMLHAEACTEAKLLGLSPAYRALVLDL